MRADGSGRIGFIHPGGTPLVAPKVDDRYCRLCHRSRCRRHMPRRCDQLLSRFPAESARSVARDLVGTTGSSFATRPGDVACIPLFAITC